MINKSKLTSKVSKTSNYITTGGQESPTGTETRMSMLLNGKLNSKLD